MRIRGGGAFQKRDGGAAFGGPVEGCTALIRRVFRLRPTGTGQDDREWDWEPQGVSITGLRIKIAFGTNVGGAASLIV